MSNHPTTFADWQNYPSTLDPIQVAWLKMQKNLNLTLVQPRRLRLLMNNNR